MKVKELNQRGSYSMNKINKINSSIKDIDIRIIPRNYSSHKVHIIKQRIGKFNKTYTRICQKMYPFIIKENIYESWKKYSYFCLTCNTHLFDKGQNKHKNHSIVSLKEIEIKDNYIINRRLWQHQP